MWPLVKILCPLVECISVSDGRPFHVAGPDLSSRNHTLQLTSPVMFLLVLLDCFCFCVTSWKAAKCCLSYNAGLTAGHNCFSAHFPFLLFNTIQFCRQKYCFLCWAGRIILLCAYYTIYCTRNVFIGYFCLITLMRVYFSSSKNYCVLAVSELTVDLLFMWRSL